MKNKGGFALLMFILAGITGVVSGSYYLVQDLWGKWDLPPYESSITTPGVAGVTTTTTDNTAAKCNARHVNPADPQAFYPDPDCTPGVTDPRITQENIDSTICVSGYTKTVRPASSYTSALKRQQIIEYGYADTDPSHYEEDHLIPLSLGGHPSDPKNLWPEPHPSLNNKDKVELYLQDQVCQGKMTLAEAQQKIVYSWYDLAERLGYNR